MSREELVKAADEALGPLWFGNTADLDEAVRDVIDAIEPQIRAAIAATIRELTLGPSDQRYNQGYDEAVDIAARLAEDRHTIVECCNSRCSSPIYNLHCHECEEIERAYDSDHIEQHADPEDLRRSYATMERRGEREVTS